MKLTLIQTDITWNEPKANLERLSKLIDSVPGSDMYILPEMFNTGFVIHPSTIAEGASAEAEEWMKAMVKQTNACLAGSVATLTDAGYVNRCHVMAPDGAHVFYDKHHLFTYGGEDKHFAAGTEQVQIEVGGVRIRPLVCYDLRFPVWSRQQRNAPYDLLFYVASWPESRDGAWRALLHARAIENQCYVAGVNRIGADPACKYCGGSMIIDPYGHDLAVCPDNTECTVTATLDMERLRAFRKKFPVLEDADNYTLNK